MLIFYPLCFAAIFYGFYKINYFTKRSLKDFQRRFSFGNSFGLLFNRYNAAGFMDSIAQHFAIFKLVELCDFRESVYFVRDLLRQIIKSDFDYLEYHVTTIESESDSLLGEDLFLLSERKWHDMGTALSQVFTSTRMRQMFELVVECTEDVVEHLIAESKQCTTMQWELEELFSRYSSDVTASAIGLKVNSFKHRTNGFYTSVTEKMNSNEAPTGFESFLIRALPKIIRELTFEFSSAHVKRFFKLAILDEMKDRAKEQTFRPDMINMLMQMRSGELKYQEYETSNADSGFTANEESLVDRIWTDDEIVAPCFHFFAAELGTSCMMSFISYELAMHQDIQQKIYDEILETSLMLDGARISYDLLSNLKYLDQVVSEALRKYPEKFDPVKFSDENKHEIEPATYTPFGYGKCYSIGSSFALMEIKTLFYYLLLSFIIEPCEKNAKTDKNCRLSRRLAHQEWNRFQI